MDTMRAIISYIALSWVFIGTSSAFVVTPGAKNGIFKSNLARLTPRRSTRMQMSSTTSDDVVTNADLHVVLFGLGDLRVSDHGGLHRAMEVARKKQSSGAKVLPLFVLDERCLVNFPGCRTASADSATMVSSAIQSLSNRLKEDVGLNLQIRIGTTEESISKAISDCNNIITGAKIAIHVCDLGPADNDMKYGPLSFVSSSSLLSNSQLNDSTTTTTIVPWKCDLRSAAWDAAVSDANTAAALPMKYPDYQNKFCNGKDAAQPLPTPDKIKEGEMSSITCTSNESDDVYAVPSENDVMDVISMGLFGKKASTAELPDDIAARIGMEKATGLFGTHWGGVNSAICDEADALQGLQAYADAGGDDDVVLHSKWYNGKLSTTTSNKRSLEHASINWMSENKSSTKNLLRGELMTRYMTAPLTLGCVSVRQLWHAQPGILGNFLFQSQSPLRDIAEANEWHKLFAARNICNDVEFQRNGEGENKKQGEMAYAYWRWQGFLCRYAVSSLTTTTQAKEGDTTNNSALVLIHGFGASGSQWSKNIKELSKSVIADQIIPAETSPKVAFAPDLIGFGQCEKPGVTYTQYLWESYAGSFVKEIVQGKYNCGDYVVGGNSIGGYTSMSCAADDVVPVDASYVSSSGAPGSGKCKGVFLMNSAGQIRTKTETLEGPSVAETTIAGGLPPCSPPARPIALAFGNALLWYLRPRIQSICSNLYPSNPAAVDENLCGSILRDSLDPGAINVMVSGSKLPAPRTANDLLNSDFGTRIGKDLVVNDSNGAATPMVQQGRWAGPAIVIQGMQDPLQNSEERVAGFTGLRSEIELEALTGGHCPHDELPKESADALLRWIPRAFSQQDVEVRLAESSVPP